MIEAKCITTTTNPSYFPCDPSIAFELDGAVGVVVVIVFCVIALLTVVKALR